MSRLLLLQAVVLLTACSSSKPPSDLAPTVINDIRMWHAPEHSRIVFDMDKRSRFKVFTLAKPDRIVIDLANAKLKRKLKRKMSAASATGQFVRKIRVGTRGGNTTRLVFDLNKPIRYQVGLLQSSGKFNYRLVVNLYHPDYDPKKAAPLIPYQPRKCAPRDPQRALLVMLDPGHGGEDFGARGKRTLEKNVVLQIARRLKKMIDRAPGMRAELTRNGDYYVGLHKRRVLARNQCADMFVSIHADAFKNPQARGASVYALSLDGATSEAAKLLANKENVSDFAGGINLADKDASTAGALVGMGMDITITESKRFAAAVLTELKTIGAVHSNTVEQAGFVILKLPDMSSILVETAYITNPRQEKQLRSGAHQNKIARAIIRGIKRYVAKTTIFTRH